MHPGLAALQPYPFERLARLKAGITPPAALEHIAMSIGEPQHAPPPFVFEVLAGAFGELSRYPATAGLPELRGACAHWLERRYALGAGAVDAATMVLPVNGSREALFALAQAMIDPAAAARVAMPNPFYQIYEGAALLAGARPLFLPLDASGLPDFDAVAAGDWERCRLLYLCSPGNPSGAVLGLDRLARLLGLAERHGFVIAADECYAEVYADEAAPPPGLLQACQQAGRSRYEGCVVFHSLSKRSSLPGLRSGFVAGDARLIEAFLAYRTYHGSAMPLPTQRASIAAWQDEAHVIANRALYRAKFSAVLPVLAEVWDLSRPAGAFYLWPRVGDDDEAFARGLFARQNLTVLPGRYLSRTVGTSNPGAGHVRISLVAPLERCIEAAHRICNFVKEG